MSYRITKGLLREGSLSAKIYFLLLTPKTQSEVSRILYQGKIQLANINKNIGDLEKKGYIKNIGRKIGQGKNFNQIYYKSTLKPVLNFIKEETEERKKTSKSKNKESIGKEDINFLKAFLESKWFSYFYSQGSLKDNLECENVGNIRICSNPIRFFAFLLEEIFVIRRVFERAGSWLENDNLGGIDFDGYITTKSTQINLKQRILANKILASAKGYLGDYAQTNRVMDSYFRKNGVLFIPYKISRKLSCLGRIPLTVFNCFKIAIEDECNL